MADAEREASEVLHSLLSVERIENKPLPSNATTTTNVDDSNMLWHTPVQGIQSTFLKTGEKTILKPDMPSSSNQDQVRYSFGLGRRIRLYISEWNCSEQKDVDPCEIEQFDTNICSVCLISTSTFTLNIQFK